MSRALPIALALALGGCATTNAKNPAASLERIAMRSNSFWHSATTGSPFHSEWQIDRSGEGRFRSFEASRDARNVLRVNDVTRGFSVKPRDFQKIEALLRLAERSAGGEVPCEDVPYTDSTLGTVTWNRGGVPRQLEFDQGCPTKAATAIFRRINRAQALIEKWAANGRIKRSVAMPDRPDPARPK